MGSVTRETNRGLRSDAQVNRDRILTAAAEAFAESGLGVSLVEIARRAQVGNATVHRNFTKEELVDELYRDWFARRRAFADIALDSPDPWTGLAGFLEDVIVDGARNRAIGPLFAVRTRWRQEFIALIARLLERAKGAGVVRADVTAEDVTLILLAVGRTMRITADSSALQWKRHLALSLDGMRPRGDELPGTALTPDELHVALCRWGTQVLRGEPAG